MARKVAYPEAIDTFGLSRTREDHDAEIFLESSPTIEDLAIALRQVELKVGSDDSGEATSVDFRLRTAEAEIDAITTADANLAADLAALSLDAARLSAANTFALKQTAPDLDLTGKVLKYNNVATEGYGLPAIVDSTAALNQQDTSMTDTAASSSAATGVYRASIHVECIETDMGTSTVHGTVKWVGAAGDTISASTPEVTLSATTQQATLTVTFRHTGAGADSVLFSTTYTKVGGSVDDYNVYWTLERLA